MGCSQQHREENESSFAFDTSTVISLNFDSIRQKDIEISRIYADSLNQWSTGALPKFLERDLENEHPHFSEDIHHLRSFREALLDQVHSRKVLEAILESKNKLYSVQGQTSRIPHSSLSIRDLAKLRYEALPRE